MSKAKIVIFIMVLIGITSPFWIKFLNTTLHSSYVYKNEMTRAIKYSKKEYSDLKNNNDIPDTIDNIMNKIMSLI